MRNDKAVFVPSLPIDADTRQARFIEFEPGTRTLSKGFQVGPQFAPLPDDIVFDKDVPVTLRDGTVSLGLIPLMTVPNLNWPAAP